MLIYSLFTFIILSLYFLYVYVHPSRFISQITPKDLGLEYEDIILKTKDGIKLASWFIPQINSKKAIIVCHGYPADKGDVLSAVAFLASHYNLVLFDFRAMGKSQGRFTTGGWREREDFLTAVRFLKERGFNDIGAWGFSFGAAVILMSESLDIKVIVSDSSYTSLTSVLNLIFQNFGILRKPFVGAMKLWSKIFFKIDVDKVSPLKYIPQIKASVFLIHSQLDSQIPVEHAQLLHRANPKNKFWIIPEADHGEGLALKQTEYQEKVLNFFLDYL